MPSYSKSSAPIPNASCRTLIRRSLRTRLRLCSSGVGCCYPSGADLERPRLLHGITLSTIRVRRKAAGSEYDSKPPPPSAYTADRTRTPRRVNGERRAAGNRWGKRLPPPKKGDGRHRTPRKKAVRKRRGTPPPLLSLPLEGVGSCMLPRRLFVKTKGGEEGKLGSTAKTPPPTKSVSRDN